MAIRTGGVCYSHRGEGVVFQIGNIKASRHLSFNDVNISTFPNKFSEKVLVSTSLSTICQVNLAETCMQVVIFPNAVIPRLSSRREGMLAGLLAGFRADCSSPLAGLIGRDWQCRPA
jgi:hypothetical protein